MDTNKELLTYLIDNRIFESSASALASCLGYKGRMAFSRLKEGNIRTSTVDNIVDDICTHFDLDYSDLVDITEMFRIGRILYDAIKDGNVYDNNTFSPDRILTDFVTSDFKDYPEDFSPYIPQLDELYRDRPYVYFGAVMVLYIKMKKIDPYAGNTAQFHNLLKEHTLHICSVLKQHIPENAIGHSTSLAYLSDNIIRNVPQCIYSKGERLWTLFFRESNSPLHGMYIGQTFEAGKDNETFIPKENFSLIFWNKENDDEFATIQACNIINSTAEDYTVYYGLYKYDDISNEITIKWNDGNENFLIL